MWKGKLGPQEPMGAGAVRSQGLARASSCWPVHQSPAGYMQVLRCTALHQACGPDNPSAGGLRVVTLCVLADEAQLRRAVHALNSRCLLS